MIEGTGPKMQIEPDTVYEHKEDEEIHVCDECETCEYLSIFNNCLK